MELSRQQLLSKVRRLLDLHNSPDGNYVTFCRTNTSCLTLAHCVFLLQWATVGKVYPLGPYVAHINSVMRWLYSMIWKLASLLILPRTRVTRMKIRKPTMNDLLYRVTLPKTGSQRCNQCFQSIKELQKMPECWRGGYICSKDRLMRNFSCLIRGHSPCETLSHFGF